MKTKLMILICAVALSIQPDTVQYTYKEEWKGRVKIGTGDSAQIVVEASASVPYFSRDDFVVVSYGPDTIPAQTPPVISRYPSWGVWDSTKLTLYGSSGLYVTYLRRR